MTDAIAKVGLKQTRWDKVLRAVFLQADDGRFGAVSPTDGGVPCGVLQPDAMRFVAEML